MERASSCCGSAGRSGSSVVAVAFALAFVCVAAVGVSRSSGSAGGAGGYACVLIAGDFEGSLRLWLPEGLSAAVAILRPAVGGRPSGLYCVPTSTMRGAPDAAASRWTARGISGYFEAAAVGGALARRGELAVLAALAEVEKVRGERAVTREEGVYWAEPRILKAWRGEAAGEGELVKVDMEASAAGGSRCRTGKSERLSRLK